jgi:hypothetical protein
VCVLYGAAFHKLYILTVTAVPHQPPSAFQITRLPAVTVVGWGGVYFLKQLIHADLSVG